MVTKTKRHARFACAGLHCIDVCTEDRRFFSVSAQPIHPRAQVRRMMTRTGKNSSAIHTARVGATLSSVSERPRKLSTATRIPSTNAFLNLARIGSGPTAM